MEKILHIFQHYPELAIYLTLAIGYAVGKAKLGSFSLGTVTGVLLVGIAVGQMHLDIPEKTASVFFLLFLFSVGYDVGPQFFQGLRKGGLAQALFSLIVCAISFTTAYLLSIFLGFDAGTGAGLLAGGNTSSAIIGVAQDTISQLGNISEDTKKELINRIPVAYAVTYIFGTAGTAWFLSVIGPKILGGNVAEKCKELEATLGGSKEDSSLISAFDQVTFRAYKTELVWFNQQRRVKEVEDYLMSHEKELFIQRIRRSTGEILDHPGFDTIIEKGDIIAISAQRVSIVGAEDFIGNEVVDIELLNFPVDEIRVMVINKGVVNTTIRALKKNHFMHGVGIRSIKRGGIEMPITAGLQIEKADLIEMVGAKDDLALAVKYLGFREKSGNETDIIFVGTAIVFGGLIGALSVHVGGIPLSLSTSGGTLIAGLIFGWLRSQRPIFGNIPTPSQWLMHNLGLNVFIAIVGISASESFVRGLKELGLTLFFAGIVVSILPMILGLLLGRYIFKFHPGITLGACAGAHTETAALGAVQEALKSKVPALGYTVSYAVANTVLVTAGVLLVMLLH